jgi:hypothetical protein
VPGVAAIANAPIRTQLALEARGELEWPAPCPRFGHAPALPSRRVSCSPCCSPRAVAGLRYEIDLVAPPPAEIPDGGPAFAEGSFSKVDGILFLTTYGATSMETRTRIVSTSDGSALSVHTTFFTMHLVGAMREQA